VKYPSVCSGIEAATVAWQHMGWTPVGFSEIEPFPIKVLKHHYPHVPQLGSMTEFNDWKIDDPDVLVGGTPCQSFSVAGLRKGLDDPRGNLMLTYLAIARRYRPRWLVWENVPGVLSSNGGQDFAALLRGLDELGYGWAYRVLDAQYFGVAQRRRRVFVVASARGWQRAAAVLFERHSLSGHPAPSRQKGEGSASSTSSGAAVGSLCARTGQSISVQDADQGHLISWPAETAPTLDSHYGDKMGLENQHINGGGDCLSLAKCLITKTRLDAETETLIPTNGGHFVDAIALAENTIGRQPENGGNGDGFTVGGPMYTLNATGVHGVAQPIGFESNMSLQQASTGDIFQTLTRRTHCSVMTPTMAVRRLTPVECERLQGFPDGYTDIMPNGKPTPDGPRYKALGNSMAVPVMRWIGERINAIEQ
jgi:DNA (cytosine-5)-methyltransferase 1